jgi:2-oxoglutarate dehydrogenase E2 component (dihydrolipoamide succinyltransferase)
MMYLALTYDHRLVDGREAVTFLVKVKQDRIEDPARLLLGSEPSRPWIHSMWW